MARLDDRAQQGGAFLLSKDCDSGPGSGSGLCCKPPFHLPIKAISCFSITSFLYVAQLGDRGPLPPLLTFRDKKLGV